MPKSVGRRTIAITTRILIKDDDDDNKNIHNTNPVSYMKWSFPSSFMLCSSYAPVKFMMKY